MSAQKARGGLETIDIKGKPYVTVAERIKAVTNLEDLNKNRYQIERWERFELDGRHFLTCYIAVGINSYSGTSQISFTGGMVNTTSGYENAETSALGRALAFAGIGLLEGVASADEIVKAEATRAAPLKPKTEHISAEQIAKLLSLAKAKGYTDKADAVAFLNRITVLDDFMQLEPEHFDSVKQAVSMADAKEPF